MDVSSRFGNHVSRFQITGPDGSPWGQVFRVFLIEKILDPCVDLQPMEDLESAPQVEHLIPRGLALRKIVVDLGLSRSKPAPELRPPGHLAPVGDPYRRMC
jgi:hypothetical protein